MIWQDVVIMLASIVFAVSLIPMVLRKHGMPPLTTSIPTVIGLLAITFCFATLGLTLSMMITFVTALAWSKLAITEYRYGGNE